MWQTLFLLQPIVISPSLLSVASEVSTGEPLPFALKDLKQAIPAHCFQSSLARSLAYLGRDLGIIAGLYALAAYIDSWWFVPIFWALQGTMFWALFVVGHDCGHGSFSRYPRINHAIGHLCHTPILVPYHGWRISHRTHHANTGNVDTDESWYPLSADAYEQLPWAQKLVRFNLLLLAYPIYLFKRSPGRKGSHFNPNSPLFRPSERQAVLTSSVLWGLMVAALGLVAAYWGLGFLVKYYVGPYVVFVIWLDLVTYLHHTEQDIPWYRSDEWFFLRGALSTIDRDYGWVNHFHHDIGTHVAHHIYSSIPHYHLKTATEAIKPVLGDYYRSSSLSIWQSFWNSCRTCRFIPNRGSKVYYQAK